MDMSKYKGMFLDESREHLEAMNSITMRMEEGDSDPELIASLFRHAHSMKGMAASMGYDHVASLAHALEDMLDLVRGDKLELSDEITNLVFYRRPLAHLRAVSLAVSRLDVADRIGICGIGAADLAEIDAGEEHVRGLSSFLITAEELDAVAVIRERGDESIDVSMRSKPHFDLVPAAVSLGGGGHPQAAGASLTGGLAEAVTRVREAIGTYRPVSDVEGGS